MHLNNKCDRPVRLLIFCEERAHELYIVFCHNESNLVILNKGCIMKRVKKNRLHLYCKTRPKFV